MTNVCRITDESARNNYIKNVNANLYVGVNSLYNLYNYKRLKSDGLISTNDCSSDITTINSAMESYKSKFIEEIDFYIHVGRGIGKILPLIYFSILLIVAVGSIMLLTFRLFYDFLLKCQNYFIANFMKEY